MIKINLYFDEVAVDNVHASCMEEAFDMIHSLEGFWDQNEVCIDYWFNTLKRFSEPQSVRLCFDMSDYETKCWKLFDEITEYYSYDYKLIDNTVVFDANIHGFQPLKKIGYNDIPNGHFEYPTIERALIEFLDTLETTNKIGKENGNSPTWHPNVIEFIKSLIPKKNCIEEKDIEDLNEILKSMNCAFKFAFSKSAIMSTTIEIVPTSNVFIDSSIININDKGYYFIRGFFRKRGINITHNNTRSIFWAMED